MKKVSEINESKLCDFARDAIESCILNDAPIVWFWFPNSKFSKGDKAKWNDMIFTCKEDHISGEEFDIKYWEKNENTTRYNT